MLLDPYAEQEFRQSLAGRIQDVENREFMRVISGPQREMVLDRQLFFARQDVSNQLLHEAQFGVIPLVERDCTRFLAKAMIPGKLKREELVIKEEPRYGGWKHELIAGLPEISFRRRLLERLWGINGNERLVVEHVVTADTGYVFPECTMLFPDSLGQIRFMTDVKDHVRKDY